MLREKISGERRRKRAKSGFQLLIWPSISLDLDLCSRTFEVISPFFFLLRNGASNCAFASFMRKTRAKFAYIERGM